MTEHPLHDSARLGPASGAEEANDPDRPLVPTSPISTPLSALSFWLAIALPAVYLPLLFTGLSTVADLVTFLGLFAAHVVALLGGRSHRRD